MTNVAAIRDSAIEKIDAANDLQALEEVRVELLGKQGIISAELKKMGSMSPEERQTVGAELNKLKNEVADKISSSKEALEHAALDARLATEQIDVTLDARPEQAGSLHPITQVTDELVRIFGEMGFVSAEGPQIEDDFHNFTALNIPPEHPARQMHDTFYLQPNEEGITHLLRTHTSSVQIRTMQGDRPPFRIIAPGRTYRCDSDQTHTPMFHQIEGLYVEKDANMAQLKGVLTDFVNRFFELDDVPVRFRPSFFPFTEPSAEMDIGCKKTKSELKIGEGDDWMEILGCGMVHPNVLSSVGIDPNEYQGFAFGIGIERLAMLKYGIPDLRTFFESDVRWLSHYSF